ncbi:MAG: SIR2 family protein [Chloroflexi bacterium]|nr:SIR2 family protein [Chloroflexota bacterium]
MLEYFRLVREDIAPLTNWLVANMQAPDDAIRRSPVLDALANLTLCQHYYTTNYDDFLERALRLAGRAADTVALETHLTGVPSSRPQVVKFHGDLNHPSRMVVTESDYEKRLAFRTAMDFRLLSDVLGRAVLFLGYSFRDPNVAYLFRLVNERLDKLAANPAGRRAYIVVADPSDFETRLYRARNIEVIGVSGGDLAGETAAVLRELTGDPL